MTNKDRLLDETLTEWVVEQFAKARAHVVSSMARRQDWAQALASAAHRACDQPGCEVRVTCQNLGEAMFACEIIEEGLRRMHRLDEKRTRPFSIEVTNGSVIVVRDASKPALRAGSGASR